jgi:hypothetical protein
MLDIAWMNWIEYPKCHSYLSEIIFFDKIIYVSLIKIKQRQQQHMKRERERERHAPSSSSSAIWSYKKPIILPIVIWLENQKSILRLIT